MLPLLCCHASSPQDKAVAAAVAEAVAKAREAAEQAQAEAVAGAAAEARAAAVEETTSMLLDLIYLGTVRGCDQRSEGGALLVAAAWVAAVGAWVSGRRGQGVAWQMHMGC